MTQILILAGLFCISVGANIYLYKRSEKRRLIISMLDQIVDFAAGRTSFLGQSAYCIERFNLEEGSSEYSDKLSEIFIILSTKSANGFPRAYPTEEFVECFTNVTLQKEIMDRLSVKINNYLYLEEDMIDVKMAEIAEQYIFASSRGWSYYLSIVITSFNYVEDEKNRAIYHDMFLQKVLQRTNVPIIN